jgi:hypothetical protein
MVLRDWGRATGLISLEWRRNSGQLGPKVGQLLFLLSKPCSVRLYAEPWSSWCIVDVQGTGLALYIFILTEILISKT